MNDIDDTSLQVRKVVRTRNYVHRLQKMKKPTPKKGNGSQNCFIVKYLSCTLDNEQVKLAMYLCDFRNSCLFNVNTELCKHKHQNCWDLINLHRIQSTRLLWKTLASPREHMKMPIEFLKFFLKTFLYPINNQISQL